MESSALGAYLERLEPLIGDRRTKWTVRGIVEGIIASGSLKCSRIVAFSPCVQREGECL